LSKYPSKEEWQNSEGTAKIVLLSNGFGSIHIYYETFSEFKRACDDFFANTKKFENKLLSLMTKKFQIIQS